MNDHYDQREALRDANRAAAASQRDEPRWRQQYGYMSPNALPPDLMPPCEVLQACEVIRHWAAMHLPSHGAPWSIMGLGDVAAVRREVLREVRAKVGELK